MCKEIKDFVLHTFFIIQEISTLTSLEGLRIFPESEAICMENATAGSEASRSTEGALRIFPESEAICMENATAGSEASRSTEGALSPNPEDLSQRTCELRKASCNTHCVRSSACGYAWRPADFPWLQPARNSPLRFALRIAAGSPGKMVIFPGFIRKGTLTGREAGQHRQPQQLLCGDLRLLYLSDTEEQLADQSTPHQTKVRK